MKSSENPNEHLPYRTLPSEQSDRLNTEDNFIEKEEEPQLNTWKKESKEANPSQGEPMKELRLIHHNKSDLPSHGPLASSQDASF